MHLKTLQRFKAFFHLQNCVKMEVASMSVHHGGEKAAVSLYGDFYYFVGHM